MIARRRTEHGSGLGVTRWVVERTNAWLQQFRRLRVRFERRADIHEAFLTLGCCLIRWRFLFNRNSDGINVCSSQMNASQVNESQNTDMKFMTTVVCDCCTISVLP